VRPGAQVYAALARYAERDGVLFSFPS